MREILFRGQCRETGTWCVGNLIHRTEFYGDPVDDYHILYVGEFHCDYYDSTEVIPKTIGQFTGLYDKNGSMVFENDIVYNGAGNPGVVAWADTAFVVRFSNGDEWDISQYVNEEYTEIIGSIHDNPEILKGEEK